MRRIADFPGHFRLSGSRFAEDFGLGLRKSGRQAQYGAFFWIMSEYFQSGTYKEFLGDFSREMERWLPSDEEKPFRLHRAMRYSVEGGGKRLRPALLVAASRAVGVGADPLPAAVAVECLHTYSLIHDDLPCMDNSDLRRGRATCHLAFDEALAVLAGDALLPLSFEILSCAYRPVDPDLAAALSGELAKAAGSRQLVGGQALDLASGSQATPDLSSLKDLHQRKTGALIQACTWMGGRIAGAEEKHLTLLGQIGAKVGLVFQIVDDVLDATSEAQVLGKTAGRDGALGKPTFVDFLGVEGSRGEARRLTDQARILIESLPGNCRELSDLVDAMAGRLR